MSIPFQCAACGATFEVLPEHAGRKIKCGACGAVMSVPGHETINTSGDAVRLPPMRAKREAPDSRSAEGDSPVGADTKTGTVPLKPAAAPAKKCPRCAAPLHSSDAICAKCGCDLALASLVVAGEPRTAHGVAARKSRGSKAMTPKQKVFLFSGAAVGLIALVVLIVVLATRGGDRKVAQGDAAADDASKTSAPTSPAPKKKDKSKDKTAKKSPSGFDFPQFPDLPPMEWKPDPTPPRPQPTTTPAVRPTPGVQATFANWLQDPEAAKRRAAAESKDILMLFDGSDWCGWSIRMMYEVFFQKEFHDWSREQFVLMIVDFPRKPQAKSEVQDASRNERLMRDYGVDGFPTAVLADARGRPYGRMGYVEGGVQAFVSRARQMQGVRRQRDELLQQVARAEGAAKLEAAKKALELLQEAGVSRFYGELVDEWFRLARQHDADNQKGMQEYFFGAHWLARVVKAVKLGPDAVTNAVAELDAWKKKHEFKDPDRAAILHLYAARCLALVERNDEAAAQIKAGLAAHPKDSDLAAALKAGAAAIEGGEGSGTGFVIAADGHLLTNFHVVEDAEQKLVVRVPGAKEPVPAKVVAKDKERDMALLKIAVPDGVKLQPLQFGAADAGRGAKVAAFGYPMSDTVGATLKLTIGFVSALADESTDGMCVLDCRVNPGNSGGPLCDARGHVVGMVTAKSGGGFGVDSYGMALPVSTVREFLAKHLPEAAKNVAAPDKGDALEWEEVDRRVGPSVMMIVRKR